MLHFQKKLLTLTLLTGLIPWQVAAQGFPIIETQQATEEIITEQTATPDAEVFPDEIFPDIHRGNKYYLAAKYLHDNDLIHGYPDGYFRPDKEINRAEALKVLVGAIQFEAYSPVEKPLNSKDSQIVAECNFPDLDQTAWYHNYVCDAYSFGVIEGYPDGLFRPAQTINKVESLKIIVLQSGLPLPTDASDNFADVDIDSWYAPYTALAEKNTYLVPDRSDKIDPGANMTRGDFILLIYHVMLNRINQAEFGKATFYGQNFNGRQTASGQTLYMDEFTAAHKYLPFDTKVRVTNLNNGQHVDVRIIDRGPYVHGYIIDLTTSAFERLANLGTGVIDVKIEIIE